MERLGLVDLGSNTTRLVVYGFEPGVRFRMEDEIREPTRLGERLSATGRLAPAAIERAVLTLGLFHDFARASGLPTLQVIATSALRDAQDRDALLDRVRGLDLEISVLSGEEEARLGVLAVANGFPWEDAWVVDLGGGSAQVSRMAGREPVSCRSLPLGGVRLTETFLPLDPPKPRQIEQLEEAVATELGPTLAAMAADDAPLVAMGGTVRNLARAVQKRRGYPLDLLHGYFLARGELERLVAQLLGLKARRRALVPGIHPDRADVILAGALVYRLLLSRSGRDGLWISGQGVREGVFYHRFLPPPHLLPAVRGFSIENLFLRFPQPEAHTRQVTRLAFSLYDQLSPLHGLGAWERELLAAAARLHDIGSAINYYDHHKHGEYLINGGALPGFFHREQALIALTVRYHRKGTPKVLGYGPVLRKGDARRLLVLATCLRLAEMLERSRAGRVQDVEATLRDGTVTVTLLARENPQVGLWEAAKQARLFQQAFDRRLDLQVRLRG